MTDFLRSKNAAVEVYLTATWSRADQVYLPDKPWTGQPIENMALDVRAGYDLAAAAPGVAGVNGVGEAWSRAMASGMADPNPYDGIDLDKVDLWSYDHYHASHYGYYLEALVVFGNLTGLDPRSLGVNECSGYELGMSRTQIQMLQQAAYDQLASEGRVKPARWRSTDPELRCTATEPQAPCPAANSPATRAGQPRIGAHSLVTRALGGTVISRPTLRVPSMTSPDQHGPAQDCGV